MKGTVSGASSHPPYFHKSLARQNIVFPAITPVPHQQRPREVRKTFWHHQQTETVPAALPPPPPQPQVCAPKSCSAGKHDRTAQQLRLKFLHSPHVNEGNVRFAVSIFFPVAWFPSVKLSLHQQPRDKSLCLLANGLWVRAKYDS